MGKDKRITVRIDDATHRWLIRNKLPISTQLILDLKVVQYCLRKASTNSVLQCYDVIAENDTATDLFRKCSGKINVRDKFDMNKFQSLFVTSILNKQFAGSFELKTWLQDCIKRLTPVQFIVLIELFNGFKINKIKRNRKKVQK